MTVRKLKLSAITDVGPYTLTGAAGGSDHDKRINVVNSLADKTVAINTFPLAPDIATVTGIEEVFTVTAPMKMSGIVLARAYIDGTENTGEIKIGKPVAFDTVTGVAVTGIPDSWIPAEYLRIGLSLDNFSKVQPYVGTENLVQIKLDSPEPPGHNVFVKTPTGGIPARAGMVMSSVMCEMYDDSSGTLVPVMQGGSPKKIKVYNMVNGAIGENKIVATSLTWKGIRYVSVESCEEEA